MDVSGSQWLGIYMDDPENVPEEELRSEACVTLPRDVEVPRTEGLLDYVIPEGTYATTRHVGPYSGLGRTWGELCGGWIPQNGLKIRQGACFEIYVKGGECGVDESEYLTDLYEPVEPVS